MILCFVYVAVAAAIPCVYVGSLYLAENKLRSDHPQALRKRFRAVSIACALSVVVSYIFLKQVTDDPLQLMGFHWYGTLAAVTLPILLSMIFYLGSLTISYMDGSCAVLFCPKEWRRATKDIFWIRHTIIGPITEEVAFRACCCTLIDQCAPKWFTIIVWPLFFSLSHMHHLLDDIRNGMSFRNAISYRIFQMAYTYLFGIYASYIFLQTGHIIAPILVHSLCNTIGLPLFAEVSQFPSSTQKFLWLLHIGGFVAWACLLPYLLDSRLYTFL